MDEEIVTRAKRQREERRDPKVEKVPLGLAVEAATFAAAHTKLTEFLEMEHALYGVTEFTLRVGQLLNTTDEPTFELQAEWWRTTSEHHPDDPKEDNGNVRQAPGSGKRR